jgi:hypothetical protein
VCQSCVDIDKRIDQLRQLVRSTTDPLEVERINRLIAELYRERVRSHTKIRKSKIGCCPNSEASVLICGEVCLISKVSAFDQFTQELIVLWFITDSDPWSGVGD